MGPRVEITTLVILILSVALSSLLTKNYIEKKSGSILLWSSGMWLFSLAVALEVVFSFGVREIFLIKAYLFVVALLVDILSLGSMLLIRGKRIIIVYGVYSLAAALFLVVAIITSTVGNIITNGVVFGALPVLVVIASSALTFPAAIALIAVALLSYRKKRNPKMLSIVAGVIVVSVAGTLYIASFPAFLYFAEFIGILLLWIGFIDFKSLFLKSEVRQVNVNGPV